jgi:hypothetical protein
MRLQPQVLSALFYVRRLHHNIYLDNFGGLLKTLNLFFNNITVQVRVP